MENETMRQAATLEVMDDYSAAMFAQSTRQRVPTSVIEAVNGEFLKMFATMGLATSVTATDTPSSKLPPRKALSMSMHGYYSTAAASERGCAVYGTDEGKVVFVTDLSDVKLDEWKAWVVGQYTGVLTHYYCMYECGHKLTDRATPNPRRSKVAKRHEMAEEIMVDGGRIDTRYNVPARELDIEDPFDSKNLLVRLFDR